MGVQTMGSQHVGDINGKQSQLELLVRKNSMYSLTLDEVQSQLGDLGKPLSSMNLDELLKNVWTSEASQPSDMEIENTSQAGQSAIQHQSSLSLTSSLSKKSVDEVWRGIQQSKWNEEKRSRERKPTFGEITLEDFLVKAGVVAEASSGRKNIGNDTDVALDSSVSVLQFPQQGRWMQYQPQYQHPQQNMMGMYMPPQPMSQQLHVGVSAAIDAPYLEGQVSVHSPLMEQLSDTQMPGRKKETSGKIVEKTVDWRQKRMIKNRESAARSRARKQAYTNELENKVMQLEEENEKLKQLQEIEKNLQAAQPAAPRYQLRRTSSTPF